MSIEELKDLCKSKEEIITESWLIKKGFEFTSRYMIVAYAKNDIAFMKYSQSGQDLFYIPSWHLMLNDRPIGKIKTTKDIIKILSMNDFINALDAIEDNDERVCFIASEFVDADINYDLEFMDSVLENIEVEKYNEDVLVALLCFTNMHKIELKHRSNFYNKVYNKLKNEIPKVDFVLYGLN